MSRPFKIAAATKFALRPTVMTGVPSASVGLSNITIVSFLVKRLETTIYRCDSGTSRKSAKVASRIPAYLANNISSACVNLQPNEAIAIC